MALNPHPTLPEFEYVKPETLTDASEFLVRHDADACPFLGGTDVFVRMRDGLLTPKYLVDVKHLPGMNDLYYDPMIGLTIGAAVNMNRVITSPDVQKHYSLLADACHSVASYQLRTRATIVGNICNASPAGDTIGANLLFGGVLQIQGVGGLRQEPLENFFLGPGKTKLKVGDLVIALHLPTPPVGNQGVYLKLGRNQLSDLSIVGVTALGYPDTTCTSGYRFKLALASVAPIPLMIPDVTNHLVNNPISPETIQQAAHLAEKACTPIDDVRGGARYRKHMVRNLSSKALTIVWQKLV